MASLRFSLKIALALLAFFLGQSAHAQARFDLPGPKIDIRVTRGDVTLPLSSVPNLLPGDKVWLHPDFPASQSAHYLLIAAFLRGTTNPPPDNWFTRIDTWDKKVREEGVFITVPEEAQQAILFLAPETSGDFGTLRSAVKGRPGVFVRAAQDLTEAGFEQGRIEKYLAAMKQVPPGDAKALQEHSDLLARTLNLKPNPDCYKRPLDQQYTCLTQTGTQTLLDDGHAQSIAAALSNGPSSDFINQASYTRLAGAGDYSAYVGAIVDLVRLTSGLHTAKYQYIPAIAFPATEDLAQPPSDDPAKTTAASLDLRLNTPPSFHDPKSVIVIGLPSVQKTVPPPLRPVDSNHVSCLLDPHLVLPIEGAPLVFSTAFAHSLVVHLDATQQDIAVRPDAYQGGLVLLPNIPDRHELPLTKPPATVIPVPGMNTPKPEPATPATPGAPITGTLQGMWGFDHFAGPALAVQQLPGTGWRIVEPAGKSSSDPLIVGQPNHLQLEASGTACVQSIRLEPADSKVDWKLATGSAPRPLDLTLNLPRDTAPGSLHLAVHQFGEKDPELVAATAFVEPARIEALQLHAGDSSAILTGVSLDQVKSLTFKDFTYEPEKLPETESRNRTLTLVSSGKPPQLRPNEKLTAEVHLHDNRTLPISTVVLPPRPSVSILSRRVTAAVASPIALAQSEDLPLGAQLTFFLKSAAPFPRAEQIEIAGQPEPAQSNSEQPEPATEALHTTLSVAAGSLILQDAHTILATFDPLKTFGASTFGPFRLRPIAPDGTPGDWIPLATIVRLPTLSSLTCPLDPTQPCTLAGSSLYLIDSLSLDPAFTAPTKVPEGFVDSSLAVPHPPAAAQPATLYLRLRDDPATAQQATLSVQTDTPTPPPVRRGSHTPGAAPPAANSLSPDVTAHTTSPVPGVATTAATKPAAPAATTPQP